MTDEARFEKQLSLGWQALSPPAGSKERVRARVAAADGAGGAASTGAASSAAVSSSSSRAASSSAAVLGAAALRGTAARWRALRASGALGAVAGALLLGLGFSGGYWLHTTNEATPQTTPSEARAVVAPAPTPSPSPERVAEAPASPTPEHEATSAPASAPALTPASTPTATPAHPRTEPRPSRRAARPKARAHAATADEGRELALLERAERAVRARNHELALALSDELESNYPESRLHEERRAIRLMARCQAGLDGASQSSSFEQLYPGSVYADRIAHECDPAAGTRHDP